MKAIVESALAEDPERHVELWWAAKERRDFYLERLPREWAAAYPHVHFHGVSEAGVAADFDDERVSGHRGRVDEVLAQRLADVSAHDVYLSGSPGMVYACVDVLASLVGAVPGVFRCLCLRAERASGADRRESGQGEKGMSAAPILITGGAQRLGRHCAERLCDDGHPVIVTYRRERPALDALRERGIVTLQADFGDEAGIRDFMARLRETTSSLRAIVHNASDWLPDAEGGEAGTNFEHLFRVHMLAPYLINLEARELLERAASRCATSCT